MVTFKKTEKGIIEIWLTNAERHNEKLRKSLRQKCLKWKQQGLLPVIYFSGQEDLYEHTLALLDYNKNHPKTG